MDPEEEEGAASPEEPIDSSPEEPEAETPAEEPASEEPEESDDDYVHVRGYYDDEEEEEEAEPVQEGDEPETTEEEPAEEPEGENPEPETPAAAEPEKPAASAPPPVQAEIPTQWTDPLGEVWSLNDDATAVYDLAMEDSSSEDAQALIASIGEVDYIDLRNQYRIAKAEYARQFQAAQFQQARAQSRVLIEDWPRQVEATHKKVHEEIFPHLSPEVRDDILTTYRPLAEAKLDEERRARHAALVQQGMNATLAAAQVDRELMAAAEEGTTVYEAALGYAILADLNGFTKKIMEAAQRSATPSRPAAVSPLKTPPAPTPRPTPPPAAGRGGTATTHTTGTKTSILSATDIAVAQKYGISLEDMEKQVRMEENQRRRR